MTENSAFADDRSVARIVLFLAVLFLPLSRVHAQSSSTLASHAPALVDVVALRVEFQPDTTRFTTGDGTFDGILFEGVDNPSIDPLPHDWDYFDAHIRFLENYISRVSDGRTEVRSHLLSTVVQVSGTMGDYSPTGEEAGSDAELAKLAALSKEAWSLAAATGVFVNIRPNSNVAFVLFHAGVGRDIELTGTSLDKTPQDLPSIFFDGTALDRLGASGVTFSDLPVDNTLIIPRTESRLGFNFITDEAFLVELSINGMLTASFMNYLNVPDLFNTTDGSSGIGPFGVMDALGIFAFSGLFPPEPSAWTKQYLGWSDTIVDPLEGQSVVLTHTGDAGRNEAARISISDAEYFLVENRHRDPEGDGVNITVWTPEGERTLTYTNDDPDFNTQTISAFEGGVVVDVDNYDFALPGGVDENDNPLLGGMLIWHVDENRLNARLSDNSVNAFPDERAVDLEEADGAQDIGFSSNAGFFGPRFDLGTPFDFWYQGNPVTVRTNTGQDIQLYQNRFASDTLPSSDANSGTSSTVNISDFSTPGVQMSFTVGSSQSDGPLLLSENLADREDARLAGNGILIPGPAADEFWTFELQSDTEAVLGFRPGNTSSSFVASLVPSIPAVVDEGVVTASPSGFFLHTVEGSALRTTSISDDFSGQSLTGFSPRIAWVDLAGERRFFLGAIQGNNPVLLMTTLRDDGTYSSEIHSASSRIRDIVVPDRNSIDMLILTDNGIVGKDLDLQIPFDGSDIREGALMSGLRSDAGWSIAWPSRDAGRITIIDESGSISQIEPPVTGCSVSDPTWTDMGSDGRGEIIFSCGEWLVAAYPSGAIYRGFPLRMDASSSSRPIVSVESNGNHRIHVMSVNGYLEAYRIDTANGRGIESMSGYPVPVGIANGMIPVVGQGFVAASSATGTIRKWADDAVFASNVHASDLVMDIRNPPNPSAGGASLLVEGETYNWPNPVRNGETRIRVGVTETSDVTVVIVDMTGTPIDEFELPAVAAGVPSEIVWKTEAGSGVYLARIEASSASGRKDTRLIKLAIIR